MQVFTEEIKRAIIKSFNSVAFGFPVSEMTCRKTNEKLNKKQKIALRDALKSLFLHEFSQELDKNIDSVYKQFFEI